MGFINENEAKEICEFIANGSLDEAQRICSAHEINLFPGLWIARQATSFHADQVHETVMQKLCAKMADDPTSHVFHHRFNGDSDYPQVVNEHALLCGLMPYQAAKMIWHCVEGNSKGAPENIALLLERLPQVAVDVLLDMEHRNRSLFALLANNEEKYGSAYQNYFRALLQRGDYAQKLNLSVPKYVLDALAQEHTDNLDILIKTTLRDAPKMGIECIVERLQEKVILCVDSVSADGGCGAVNQDRLLAVLAACARFPEKIELAEEIPQTFFTERFVESALKKEQDALIARFVKPETLQRLLVDQLEKQNNDTPVHSCILRAGNEVATMAIDCLSMLEPEQRKKLIKSLLVRCDNIERIELIFTRLLKQEEVQTTAAWLLKKLEEECRREGYIGYDMGVMDHFGELYTPKYDSVHGPHHGNRGFDCCGRKKAAGHLFSWGGTERITEDYSIPKIMRDKIKYLEFLEQAGKAGIEQAGLAAAYKRYNLNAIEKGVPSLETDVSTTQDGVLIGQKGKTVYILLEGGRVSALNLETGLSEILESIPADSKE